MVLEGEERRRGGSLITSPDSGDPVSHCARVQRLCGRQAGDRRRIVDKGLSAAEAVRRPCRGV